MHCCLTVSCLTLPTDGAKVKIFDSYNSYKYCTVALNRMVFFKRALGNMAAQLHTSNNIKHQINNTHILVVESYYGNYVTCFVPLPFMKTLVSSVLVSKRQRFRGCFRTDGGTQFLAVSLTLLSSLCRIWCQREPLLRDLPWTQG